MLLDKMQSLFRTVTSAVMSFAALGGSGWVVSVALTQQPVLIERIELPASLEEKGYKSEVVIQQILDEVRVLQDVSRSEKTGSAFFDKALASSQKIDLNMGGLSAANIEKLVRSLIGNQPKIITGEILLLGKPDASAGFSGRLRVDSVAISKPVGAASEAAIIKKFAFDLYAHFEPFGTALAAFRLKDYDAARDSLRRILADGSPEDRKYALWLRAKMSSPLQEEADLLEALEIDAKFHLALVPMVDFKRRQSRFDEALEFADRSIDADKASPYGYHEKGRVFRTQAYAVQASPDPSYRDRKLVDALAQFELACGQKQKYAPCFNQIGEITLFRQENAGKDEQIRAHRVAHESFLKAIKTDGSHAMAHSNAAYAASWLGNQTEALALINRALLIDPASLTARIRYAAILSRMGKKDDAAAVVKALLNENPGLLARSDLGWQARTMMNQLM